jgi:hypothetical protein
MRLFKSDYHALKSATAPKAFLVTHMVHRKIARCNNFKDKYMLENSAEIEEPGQDWGNALCRLQNRRCGRWEDDINHGRSTPPAEMPWQCLLPSSQYPGEQHLSKWKIARISEAS